MLLLLSLIKIFLTWLIIAHLVICFDLIDNLTKEQLRVKELLILLFVISPVVVSVDECIEQVKELATWVLADQAKFAWE